LTAEKIKIAAKIKAKITGEETHLAAILTLTVSTSA
jgi:hypothetical protein